MTQWEGVPDDYQKYAGFVYEITNLTNGRKYIGKKYFWSKRRIKVKGRKNRRRVTKESNWKSYKSSCKELLTDIKTLGEDKFIFQIIFIGFTRRDVNYMEAFLQFTNDVLNRKLSNGEYQYYNSNILRKFFRK